MGTVVAIAVSVLLLLGVEKVRNGARQSFADTISGTDLVVGARSGALQLLLYSFAFAILVVALLALVGRVIGLVETDDVLHAEWIDVAAGEKIPRKGGPGQAIQPTQ